MKPRNRFILVALAFLIPIEAADARWRWSLSPRQKIIRDRMIRFKKSLGAEGLERAARSPMAFGAKVASELRKYESPRLFGAVVGPVFPSVEALGESIGNAFDLPYLHSAPLGEKLGAGSMNNYFRTTEGRGLRVSQYVLAFRERGGGFQMTPQVVEYLNEELSIYRQMARFHGPETYGISIVDQKIGLVIEHVESISVSKEALAAALSEYADRAVDTGFLPSDLRWDNVVMTADGIRPIDVEFIPLNAKRIDSVQYNKLEPNNARGFPHSEKFSAARENMRRKYKFGPRMLGD